MLSTLVRGFCFLQLGQKLCKKSLNAWMMIYKYNNISQQENNLENIIFKLYSFVNFIEI